MTNKKIEQEQSKFEHLSMLIEENGNRNVFSSLLKSFYGIYFEQKRHLTEQQKSNLLNCLHIVADNKSIGEELRTFCYSELGSIYSGNSEIIVLR